MSLYSFHFELLPRPPRSAFSIGSEETRATLPDFATVAELSDFTNRLFNWHLHIPHVYAQTILGCSVIFIIVAVVGLIMIRRIYEGKFWLFRVIRKPTGVIVVPNPMLAFLLMAGLYGLIFTPFFFVACRKFTLHTGPPKHIVTWLMLPWLLLAYGVILAILGTYFATPDALRSSLDENELPPLQRFFRRADVINSLAIIIPTLLTLTIVIPVVIASNKYDSALTMEKTWQVNYSSMTTFTQEMVQQSQLIWFEELQAAKICSIVFVIWTIFAFTSSFLYFFVAFRLIIAVRQDIDRARKQKREIDQVDTLAVATEEEASVVASQIVRDALQANQPRQSSSSRLQQSSISSIASMAAACKELSISREKKASAEKLKSQSKNLEQALFHILLQLLPVGSGAACFGMIALTMAITLHSKLEQPSKDGGNLFEWYIGATWMFLMYMTCVAGGLNIFTVGYKTYEPVFTTMVLHRQGPAGQIKFTDIAKGPAHIRTTFFESPPMEVLLTSSSNIVATGRRQLAASESSTYDTINEEIEPSAYYPGNEERTWDIEAR